MFEALRGIDVGDDDRVAADHISLALTVGPLAYDDGAVQMFETGGATTYIEHGRETRGRWHVDDKNRFCSFWPPSSRACYDLRWIVERGNIVGLRFTDVRGGARFDGRYR